MEFIFFGNFELKEISVIFALHTPTKVTLVSKVVGISSKYVKLFDILDFMKYIIVGGVAGGATAAARLRRLSEDSNIVLFEKGEHISYANCGLPYYIGGTIKERDTLFLQTPEAFAQRFNVDVRTRSEVVAIDRERQCVHVHTADGRKYEEPYDKLLLSTGALPIIPPIEGIENQGVFTLRNVEDTDAISTYITQHQVSQAVVVGGGFIGLEMAENLHQRGIAVSIVEMGKQVMAPIDYSMAAPVHQTLQKHGIGLYLEQAVECIIPDTQGLTVLLSTGQTLSAQLVLLSIGVRPNTVLAKEAHLALTDRGALIVDEYLRTNDSNIYAVGDAIAYPHPIHRQPWSNYLAGPANRQARLAADHMAGLDIPPYEGSIGTAIAKVFDLTVATTGLPAKALQAQNIPYKSITIFPNSHAGYYPEATPMQLKLTFHPEHGLLYGAQIVGYDGVDKRIDSIAQIIKQGGSIAQLMQTEQAYAPPYSSAKDPVAMAGYVAENVCTGRMPIITWRDMQAVVEGKTKATILDVRTPHEYALQHIEGAINIPLDELRQRLDELDTTAKIYVHCAVGLRGYLATRLLRSRGFTDVYNLTGGYRLYQLATARYGGKAHQAATPSTAALTPSPAITLHIDACGLACPGPILRLKEGIERIAPGQTLCVVATDPGFLCDAEAWCGTTGHRLLSHTNHDGKPTVIIEKQAHCSSLTTAPMAPKGKTLICFSDDLDKVLATFVLANGAAATGQKVSIFFTFWGLNAIKRKGVSTKKDLWGKLFGLMLPKDSLSLSLSKMNMGGIGARMMRHIMRKRGVDTLESLREQAIAAGVEFIACQMSMDVMGVTQEELLPNVTIGGVATYMNRAEQASVNLFI